MLSCGKTFHTQDICWQWKVYGHVTWLIQHSSRVCLHSIKIFLPSFYPWCHSHEKMYQALSHLYCKRQEAGWGPGNEADGLSRWATCTRDIGDGKSSEKLSPFQSPNSSVRNSSLDCHMIITWLSQYSHITHMTVSILSHDSHNNHMTHMKITWLSLASALPGNETWQSHDPHMTYLIGDHAELSVIIRTLNNYSVHGNQWSHVECSGHMTMTIFGHSFW